MPRAVIFDVDGTLVDSVDLHALAWHEAMIAFGHDVSFDLTNARVVVADNNADGMSNLTDVAIGDKVVVKARLHKKNPGPEPFTAKKLVDQTHPPPATP